MEDLFNNGMMLVGLIVFGCLALLVLYGTYQIIAGSI